MAETLKRKAFDLISRTNNWLFDPKNDRWISGAWARTNLDDYDDLEDGDLENENWKRSYMREHCERITSWWDDEEACDECEGCEESRMILNSSITQACTLGGLLVNNDFKKDEVYWEAVKMLDELIDKSVKQQGIEFEIPDWYDNEETKREGRIARYNDWTKDGDDDWGRDDPKKNNKNGVKNLFRSTMNRWRNRVQRKG